MDDTVSKRIGVHEKDFTEGRLARQIIGFVLPIAATNMLQQLFNTADIAVVGQLAGNEALAAVGCAGPVVGLFISMITGFSIGANAVAAKFIGAKDRVKTSRAVHCAVALAIIIGLVACAAGEIFAGPILKMVATPIEVIDMSLYYLRIYFAGAVFIMIYNFSSAVMRAAGDAKRPLYVLVFSGIINVALNLLFVKGFGMSVEGVAYATVISNIIAAFLMIRLLVKDDGEIKLNLKEIRVYRDTAKEILLIGAPAAAQGMMFTISNVVVQSGINSLGSIAVAGSTVGGNIDMYSYYAVSSFGQAAVTFNAQNLGAEKTERCVKATRLCLLFGALTALAVGGTCVIFRRELAQIFTSDTAVIQAASIRVLYICSTEVLNSFIEVFSGALRGLGHSVAPMILCIFFVCGIRLIWLLCVFPQSPSLGFLFLCYPISWAATSAAVGAAYFILRKKTFDKLPALC